MTIQERIHKYLADKGLWPKQAADEVVERLKKDETVADFNGRWSDDIEGYPPFLLDD